jgi:hypothetical protein
LAALHSLIRQKAERLQWLKSEETSPLREGLVEVFFLVGEDGAIGGGVSHTG